MTDRMEKYEFNADDPRIKAIADELRTWITLDAAIDILAAHMLSTELDHAIMDEVFESFDKLSGIAKNQSETVLFAIETAKQQNKIANAAVLKIVKTRAASSQRGRVAADALHGRPGQSRDKQDAIRAAWASGKYSSRDVCAEQECAALGMAYGTARRALRNTPDPA